MACSPTVALLSGLLGVRKKKESRTLTLRVMARVIDRHQESTPPKLHLLFLTNYTSNHDLNYFIL
jgi:hypothetical protein